MGKEKKNKFILFLSFPLAVLIIIVSGFGLFNESTYSRETINWSVQAVVQDGIDLFLIIPLLIITSILSYRQNRIAILIWSGILFYITYTFIIYSFAVHFNFLFWLYCLTLGLSFYLLFYFLFLQVKEPVIKKYNNKIPVKTAGVYLLVLAFLFYLLWLSEVIPSMITNTVPVNVREMGLPVNSVHAIDLSICLPGIFIIGFLLLKKNLIGLILTPVILVFTILMNITIGSLTAFMKIKGLQPDLSVAIIMILLAAFSMILLFKFLISLKAQSS